MDGEQLAALKEHLSQVMSGERLTGALNAIEFAYMWASTEMALEAKHPDGIRGIHAAKHDHWQRVERACRALQQALGAGRPVVVNLDSSVFDAALEAVAVSAREHAADVAPEPRGPGTPPLRWRDQLISVVRSLYSDEEHAHFVRTVQLLLCNLDRDVDNVYEVITGALKRVPQPRFTI